VNLGVVGSRSWREYIRPGAVGGAIALYQSEGFDTVVSGGAHGVDTRAENTGRVLGMAVISYRVSERNDGWFVVEKWVYDPRARSWDLFPVYNPTARSGTSRPAVFRTFGSAAYWRNGLIVNDSDGVIAFWDGKSNGTRDSIEKAREAGNLLEVYRL